MFLVGYFQRQDVLNLLLGVCMKCLRAGDLCMSRCAWLWSPSVVVKMGMEISILRSDLED